MQAFVCLILCKRVVSVISLGTVITLYNQSVRLKVFRNGSVRKPGCCTCIRVTCCCLKEWNGCIAACLCDCLNLRSSEKNKPHEFFSHGAWMFSFARHSASGVAALLVFVLWIHFPTAVNIQEQPVQCLNCKFWKCKCWDLNSKDCSSLLGKQRLIETFTLEKVFW